MISDQQAKIDILKDENKKLGKYLEAATWVAWAGLLLILLVKLFSKPAYETLRFQGFGGGFQPSYGKTLLAWSVVFLLSLAAFGCFKPSIFE